MFIEVDIHSWNQLIKEKTDDLMFNSDYLEALAESFNFKIKYFILNEQEKNLLASAVFIKGKNIVIADNYTYQPLWIESALSERKKNDSLIQFINFLKKNFRKIDFRLNPDLFDIRSFKWEGFNIETRYTYLRKKDTPINKTIRARFLRIKEELPNVIVGEPTISDIQVNIDFLKILKFSKAKIAAYKTFLVKWNNLGYLKAFSVNSDDKIECSFLVLIDKKAKRAYTLMINKANRNREYIHALIYKSIIEWLDENGFEDVDFCGANMKGISKFKSFFNPQLRIYFIVRYHPILNIVYSIKQILIRNIKNAIILINNFK